MSSDKISQLLEKHLKILAQQVRLDILKKLYTLDKPISFSRLQKEVFGANGNSPNFSFHLKTLKEAEIIDSDSNGYTITPLGKKSLKGLLSIEQMLNEENRTIMIRTSKYSKEPFNINKIEEYLIGEGEMEAYLAKKIAEEVKERLSKTKIDYLTAPLMREYINGVLIENNLELVRKKLTRLGTPPYETLKLFNGSAHVQINPDQFIHTLGSDVSEQFLLLNLLPSDLADLYLSGEIVLKYLDSWSLRPLGIFLKSENLVNLVSEKYGLSSTHLNNPLEYVKFITNTLRFLSEMKPFFSEQIILKDFNHFFLSLFHRLKESESHEIFDFLISHLLHFNSNDVHGCPGLCFDFSYKTNDYSNLPNDISFLELFAQQRGPLCKNHKDAILFDYSVLKMPDSGIEPFSNIIPSDLLEAIVFYDPLLQDVPENRLILDKILLNLPLIALQANQDDGLFVELLQDKVHSIFKLFSYKEELISRKLKNLSPWQQICAGISDDPSQTLKESIRSLSFFGLNEAVKIHCGIELDRLQTSKSFALTLIQCIQDLIQKENVKTELNYSLSQAYYNEYFLEMANGHKLSAEQRISYYSPRFVRKDTSLPLEKRISLFQSFKEIIRGEMVFNGYFDSDDLNPDEILSILTQAQLPAFRYKKSFF